MGWFRDRFGRGRKRHARGKPTEEDTDSSGFTRLIQREPQEAVRVSPDNVWGEPAPPEAPVRREPSDDNPTQVPAQRGYSPKPIFQPESDYAPDRQPAESDDNRTILGTMSAVASGKLVGVLLGIEGPLTGQVVRIYDGANLIGREGQPDPLPNTPETKTISRKHALLNSDGGYFAIEPVRPENATFVNEKAIDAREMIQHGDRIRMGSSKPSTFVLLVLPTA